MLQWINKTLLLTEMQFWLLDIQNDINIYLTNIAHKRKRYQHEILKASFSFQKLFPKNTEKTTLYSTLSLYITFTMIYYYIRQE